mmetsp:Transcript_97756/g.226679  ORF Transcript_97756/g.226679 Transcript_97756/m.226679 type:complete len:333 (-) Transcript_97756:562-1560(-)
MALTDGSHKTLLVSCFFRSSTISLGCVPGRMGDAVAFMYTVVLGGFMLGNNSSNTLLNFSCAGFMSGVWKAPEVFSTLACNAPALSASSFNAKIDFSVPATEKPLGNNSLAIWQTAPEPSFFAASPQSSANLGLSRPATESMACLLALAASCMASPRSFTNFKPSSKEKTPDAVRAVYSPRESPAMTCARVTASSLSFRSFSKPARPAMYIAGWQFDVSSNLLSGPSKQSFSTSKPKMDAAFSSISLTARLSFTPDIILTYCEPWPGKSRPIGNGFNAGAAESAAVMASSPSSTGSANSPPYFKGSRPCNWAAPGRIMNQPLAGDEPGSQQS